MDNIEFFNKKDLKKSLYFFKKNQLDFVDFIKFLGTNYALANDVSDIFIAFLRPSINYLDFFQD